MENFVSILEKQVNTSEIVEKKSRFLCFSKFVETSEDAEKFYRETKKQFADAKHIVYAYRLLNLSRATDDKEPANTAGRPMLEVIQKLNLYNVMVVVVRYFGGVKLGAGPLLRVYSKCASSVLKPPFRLYEKVNKLKLKVSFADYQKILALATKGKISILKTEFLDDVQVSLICPKDLTLSFETLEKKEVFFSFKEVE